MVKYQTCLIQRVGRLYGESADDYGETADNYIPTGASALQSADSELESIDYSADSNADSPKMCAGTGLKRDVTLMNLVYDIVHNGNLVYTH